MAENLWLDRFERESGIKSSIILHGNTGDLMFNKYTGKYDELTSCVIRSLKKKGFEKTIKWDRISGIDTNLSDKMEAEHPTRGKAASSEEQAYLSEEETNELNKSSPPPQHKDVDDFFPWMFQLLSNSKKKGIAVIIDYSDHIFGNANALSEHEREWLTILNKTVQQNNTYNLASGEFDKIGNIIVLITGSDSFIPPSFYINNPLVSVIAVPLPGRTEREKFISTNSCCFKLDQDIDGNNAAKNDLIDALDGFCLKEIVQLMKLSRQIEETLKFEKLINLYKYGEKVSPWEELSKEKLEKIEERLGQRVKGQDKAIEKVKDVIIRAFTGFSGLQHSSKQKKPKGTLFFVGPTGVGKTELAKALAEFIFGDENACIRFDMSEYNHEHSDQRLVGAPPGYVGYESGGQLTNAIKQKPFCVLLFDEIEKAHGRILDKFLQILEDGRLTDGKGETVYFSEAIIIFTSNIGAADIRSDEPETEKRFREAVHTHFLNTLKRPELLNRIGDNVVPFNFIDDPGVFTQIIKKKFEIIENFVKERYKTNIMFEDSENAFLSIAEKTDKQNGGRGILNILESKLINPLAEFIFEKSEYLSSGRTIYIKMLKPEFLLFDFELK